MALLHSQVERQQPQQAAHTHAQRVREEYAMPLPSPLGDRPDLHGI
jgi:hypothetical protein